MPTSAPGLSRLSPECRRFIEEGHTTGAAIRNRSSVFRVTTYAHQVPSWLRRLVVEPETNGGLLLSVDPSRVDAVMELTREAGFRKAAVIGKFGIGPDGIEMT